MKTKFFRKLSFVLVVAMVLSLFVPAAGAFAAAKPKLNSTNKYLHLGVAKKDEFNFNIANKQKGWKYYWESADEDVAEVNEKNGVTTAVGVGKTKITCEITDADGEEVAVLEATVTVRDNIEEVEISNPVEGTLGVGEPHDFNRSFVTVSGSTKKTSAITRWSVEPDDGATIDDKGIFVATKAGEYKVIARSFQSKARYTAWQEDAEMYADYVLATDETTVVVAGSMTEVKQVNLNTVNVKFDTPMEDIDKNITLSKVVGSTKIKEVIKSVDVADDKMSANISLYVNFTPEATYVVDYTDLDPLSFVAVTTKVEDVAAIEITTSTVVLNEETEVGFKLLNKDGVDITADSNLSGRVSMTSSGGLGVFFNPATKKITIYTKDATTTITATFHTYTYDTSTGKEYVIETAGVIIGVEAAAQNITGLNAWTLGGSVDWDNINHILPLGENSYQLFVKLNTLTGTETDVIEPSTDPAKAAEYAKITFQSSDTSRLIVNATAGNVYPLKEGPVTVVVLYDGTPVAAVELVITGSRAATEVTLSSYNVVLSNNTDLDDEEEIEIKAKDQYQNDYPITSYSVERLNADFSSDNPIVTGTYAGNKITVSGKDMDTGVYYYKITAADKEIVISVTIQDGSDDEVTSYRVQLSATEVDLKFEADTEEKNITIELFGYNKDNVKVAKLTADDIDQKINITTPDTWADTNFDKDTGVYTLATSSTGNAVSKAPVGTYKVTLEVKKGDNWVPVQDAFFEVKDTQPVPVVSEIVSPTFSVSSVDIDDEYNAQLVSAVNACLKFKLDGADVTATGADAVGTNNQFNVRKVFIKQTFDNGSYIEHEVPVGYTLTYKAP